jgi:hypothetical protein
VRPSLLPPVIVFLGFSPGCGSPHPNILRGFREYERQRIFRIERFALLLIDVLASYRDQGKYELHEFALMPDHIHLHRNTSGAKAQKPKSERNSLPHG